MADQVIQEIHSQIQSKKKILATPPQEDAPSVDITNIRMPTPPSYKIGDKVESGLPFLDERGGVALAVWLPEAGARCDSGRLGKARDGLVQGEEEP